MRGIVIHYVDAVVKKCARYQNPTLAFPNRLQLNQRPGFWTTLRNHLNYETVEFLLVRRARNVDMEVVFAC